MIFLNDITYIGTDEKVDKIDGKIGQIKYFSDNEEEMKSDSFSNFYPVNTKLYKIENVNVKDAIAVEIETNVYVKAFRKTN